MRYFRDLNRQSLLFWALLLSVSLVCVQIIGLHYHGLDHDQAHQLAHDGQSHDIGIHEHTPVSEAHYALDGTHGDHHDDASAVDIGTDGWLKNSGKNTPATTIAEEAVSDFAILLVLAKRRFDKRTIINAIKFC